MRVDDRILAGLMLFVGAAQFFTGMMLGEAIQPNYNVGTNYISDLGVNETALLFNASVGLLGVLGLLAAYLLYRAHTFRPFSVLLGLSSLGALGVGLFPETTGAPHLTFALIAFLFGGLAAIVAYRVEDPPLRYISPVLGIIGLAALGLFLSGTDLGLGVGGMERMIAYPSLIWEIAFATYLMTPRAPAAAPAAPSVPPG